MLVAFFLSSLNHTSPTVTCFHTGSFLGSGFSALPSAPISCWACSVVEQVGCVPGCTTCLVTLTFLSLCFFIFKMRVIIFACPKDLMRSFRLSAWHILGAHVCVHAHAYIYTYGLGSWALDLGGGKGEVCGTYFATLLSSNGR